MAPCVCFCLSSFAFRVRPALEHDAEDPGALPVWPQAWMEGFVPAPIPSSCAPAVPNQWLLSGPAVPALMGSSHRISHLPTLLFSDCHVFFQLSSNVTLSLKLPLNFHPREFSYIPPFLFHRSLHVVLSWYLFCMYLSSPPSLPWLQAS